MIKEEGAEKKGKVFRLWCKYDTFGEKEVRRLKWEELQTDLQFWKNLVETDREILSKGYPQKSTISGKKWPGSSSLAMLSHWLWGTLWEDDLGVNITGHSMVWQLEAGSQLCSTQVSLYGCHRLRHSMHRSTFPCIFGKQLPPTSHGLHFLREPSFLKHFLLLALMVLHTIDFYGHSLVSLADLSFSV